MSRGSGVERWCSNTNGASASIVTPAPLIPRKKTLLFENAYKSGKASVAAGMGMGMGMGGMGYGSMPVAIPA